MRIIIINLGWFLKVLVSSIGVYDKWSLKTVQTEICGRLNKTPQDALQISGIDISREGFASYFCLRESPKQKVHVLRCHISALHRKQITNHKITICLLEEEEEEEEEKGEEEKEFTESEMHSVHGSQVLNKATVFRTKTKLPLLFEMKS